MDVLKSIAHCNDQKLLHKIVDAGRQRLKVLAKRNYEKKLIDVWNEAKTWKPGDTIYCNAVGMFIGSKIQRGTQAVITFIQPRARRIWVTVNGESIGFGAQGLERYNWQKTAPDNPMSESDKNLVHEISKNVLDAINQ